MTPKEKAEILFYNFGTRELAKEVCDEIIDAESEMFDQIYIDTDKGDYFKKSHRYAFWLLVKIEIDAL